MADEAPVDEVTDQSKGDETEGQDVHVPDETMQGEHAEVMEGEHLQGEEIEGEHVGGEHVGGEQTEGEQTETEGEERVLGEGEEVMGEGLEGEQKPEEKKEEEPEVVVVEEEEEVYVEPPPPDPAAPYDLTDSKELLKSPFTLRPDQLAEVEQLWELYQNYTPAYSDIDGYITAKELVYMLEALMLMTYTPEQFEELIAYCCRPPHPKGHITFEQYVKIITMRQRDQNIEDEVRRSLQLLDPEKTGSIDREYFRTLMTTMGHKMGSKMVELLIKEVDLSNDGTLGIEDIISSMGADLNPEELDLLRSQLYGNPAGPPQDEDD